MAIYSFLSASFLGGTLVLFVGSLHFSFPFVILHFSRKHLGWRKSLWVLPFLWPAGEWSFLQSRFSVSFLTFHVTQAPLAWLVQFVDVLGSSAISFWLLLLNVLIARAIEDWRTAKTNLEAGRSPQGLSWSQKYQAPFLLRRLSVITLAMFLPSPPVFGRCFFVIPRLRPEGNHSQTGSAEYRSANEMDGFAHLSLHTRPDRLAGKRGALSNPPS